MFGVPDDQIRVPEEPSIHEINARIPRRTRLNPDGGYTALAGVVILLGIGAIWFGGAYYYYFIYRAGHRQALSRDGRVVPGKITRFSSGRSATYAHYAFRVDGVEYGDNINLDYEPPSPGGDLPYLHVGDPIAVQYLPSNPLVNHPIGWAWWSWWNDVFPHYFGALFFGGGIAMAGYLYRDRRLARKGWVVEGKVTGCAPNRKVFTVYYEFLTQDNESVEGSGTSSDEYRSGSMIRVIYLRNHPKRNDIYPMSLYETVE